MDNFDIVFYIGGFVAERKTWKRFMLVNKLFYAATLEYPDNRVKFANQLCELLQRFPSIPWNWGLISGNECLSIDMARKYCEHYKDLFFSYNITFDEIL